MKIKSIIPLLVLLLTACSQEDAKAVGEKVGNTYNQSHRDNVIKNWQNRVSDSESCLNYKVRFGSAGRRHKSAASGAFVNDMQKIMEEVKAANCEYQP